MTIAVSALLHSTPAASGGISAARLLLHTIPAPPHKPAIGQVARHALDCLETLCSELPRIFPAMEEDIGQLTTFVNSMDHVAACSAQMIGLTTGYPAWTWFASTAFRTNRRLNLLVGKLLAIAILKSAEIDKRFILELRRLPLQLHDAVLTDRQFEVALGKLETKAHRKLMQLIDLTVDTAGSAQVSFNAELVTTLTNRLSSLRLSERKALETDIVLSGQELAHTVVGLLARSQQQGHPDDLVTLVCLCLGLGWALGRRTPLIPEAEGQGFLAWIDPIKGRMYVDLSYVLKDLSARATARHQTSTMLLVRPLPAALASLLHEAHIHNKRLRTLGDLCILQETATSRKKLSLSSAHHSASLARLMNSARAHALRSSRRRDLTAFATLSFELVNKSDLHYLCPSGKEVWETCSDFYEAIGLGPAVPARESCENVRIGSRVTPTFDWIKGVFSEAVQTLGRQKCGRRYTMHSVVMHHNAYARYVGLLMQLVIGGRDRKLIAFSARDWDAGASFGLMEDKPVSATRGRTPIPIPSTLATQIVLWHAHLAALQKRLLKTAPLAAKSNNDLIDRILARQDVPMLFVLDQYGAAEPLSAEHLFTGEAKQLNRDFGRHFLPDLLLEAGLPFEDVQDWLRHYSPGASTHDLLSDRTVRPSIDRLRQAIDHALSQLHINPQSGLSRE